MNGFKESKWILDYNRKVRTPFGYQRIESIHKTHPVECLKIFLESGNQIEVAKFHTFIVFGEEISAIDLKSGDHLETQTGFDMVVRIEESGTKELYDITLDQSDFENYWYYSNGVLSHNSGKSITVACYLAWLFNFYKDMNIGIVANRAAQAKEFLKNTKDIYSRLPIWLMQGIVEWNKTQISNELGMRILTDVPTSDSFRGYSINCIHGTHTVTLRDKKTDEVVTMSLEKLAETLGGLIDEGFLENSQFEILTDSGYQPFKGLRVSQNSGIRLDFDSGEKIECTQDHKILTNRKIGEFTLARDLYPGCEVDGRVVTKISSLETQRFYDPVEVSGGHTYISDGFTHHNCVVVDECAFIKEANWEEFADSIFPSQSALAWKKNIIISTAKGMNHFYDLVQKAKLSQADPQGKTSLVEVYWDEVPRYDSKGSLISPEVFKDQIIKRFGRVYFEQNYGNSFVGSSETLVAPEVLSELQPTNPVTTLDEMLKIFEEPQEGHVYVMGVDAAKDGKDFFAIQVVDISSIPFKQVATAKLQVNYLTMPDFLYEWGAYFNTAHMIIENNEGAGQSIADMLVNHFEYPNIYYDDKKFRYPGFRTTKSSRDSIIRLLQVLMNSNKLEINDLDTIGEFQKFELVSGKYQASSGHDDLIMALAIAIAPLAKMENYNDFGKFLEALKSSETLDTGSFLELGDLAFEDF